MLNKKRIAIIGAMDCEINTLKSVLTDYSEWVKSMPL